MLHDKQEIRGAVNRYCERQALIERNPEIRGTMVNEVFGTVEESLNLSEEVKTQALQAHCQKHRKYGEYATTEFMQGKHSSRRRLPYFCPPIDIFRFFV